MNWQWVTIIVSTEATLAVLWLVVALFTAKSNDV